MHRHRQATRPPHSRLPRASRGARLALARSCCWRADCCSGLAATPPATADGILTSRLQDCQRIAKVSNKPSQPGRQSRRIRREQARQLAKELLKSAREPGPPHKAYGTDLLWAFIFFLVHVPWHYIVPEDTLLSVAVAWFLWGCALFFLARLFVNWSRDKNWHKFLRWTVVATLSAAFSYFAATSIWMIAQPAYLYLVPTHNLIEAERRAFFIQQVGPRSFTNIEIALRDNKSSTIQIERISEIDAGPQNPLAPHYFWFTPSTPWDEDYTATITSSKKPKATQRLVVRSTQHVLQFAADVRVDGRSTPVLECRDHLLPASYQLAQNSTQQCAKWMDLSPELESKLEPAPYNVELPNGDLLIRKIKTLTPQPGAESQPDTRHLSEWQRGHIISEISQFPAKKILIMASSGGNTWAYAQDFRSAFSSGHWNVQGPKHVPAIYERIIDVQVSTNGKLGTPQKPEVSVVLNAFKNAGIKHREHPTLDSDIKPDLIVLWIGAKSPGGIDPDDCATISFKPKLDTTEPCAFVKQSPKFVPFPPP
jgi:hypothetical protein